MPLARPLERQRQRRSSTAPRSPWPQFTAGSARYRIVLHALDDATAKTRSWDPGQTSAERPRGDAATRPRSATSATSTPGASAVSIPLLNRAGIPQISPTSTAVGLTSGGPEASPGEPEKYYPTGQRTFARVVPNDAVQAAVQVELQRELGCTQDYVLDDGEVDGRDAAVSFQVAAKAAGARTSSATRSSSPEATDYTSLATGSPRRGADCVLVSAITENHAVAAHQAGGGGAAATRSSSAPAGWPRARSPTRRQAGSRWRSIRGSLITVGRRSAPSDYPPRAGASSRLRAPLRDARSRGDLRLRGDEPDARRDRARHRRRPSPPCAPGCWRRSSPPGTATACSGTYSIDRNGDTSFALRGVPDRATAARVLEGAWQGLSPQVAAVDSLGSVSAVASRPGHAACCSPSPSLICAPLGQPSARIDLEEDDYEFSRQGDEGRPGCGLGPRAERMWKQQQ